ncbi:hypothetical protein O7626_39925 [Micromonospora sp. WMMD1102]|uniref:hypothetical protein n=1 Tax=Micromonospora sp. WMMD1102 TaxID=3016105 RepID=UPI00241531C3|nr:hypothetical protein [Micromonospora sp. WMMD1102]MDG4791985.1 hypothetical protein [Micromonospora sp. WMMD1102]
MTVTIFAELACIRCDVLYEPKDVFESRTAIRAAASTDGWLTRSDGQDQCPGCRPPAGRKRPLRCAERQQDEIVDRYTKQRQSAPQIGRELGISTSAVYTALTRAGVQRAPKGWPKGQPRGARIGGTHVR